MCAIYIPPDKNVFYRKYECDIFDVLQEEIELYSVDGNVAVIGHIFFLHNHSIRIPLDILPNIH
jgi:hypothetical protein